MKTARIEGDLIISVEGGPLAGNLRPLDIRKDNNTWLVLCPDRETAYLAAEAAARAPELAAENERLKKVCFDQSVNFQATFDEWMAASKLAEERGERIIKLEREAERLRGLLASLASAAERVLVILTARFQNDYRANGMTDEGALETAQGLTIITGLREAIEAAKEVTK